MVAFAASDDARFVTGQFLDATGGRALSTGASAGRRP